MELIDKADVVAEIKRIMDAENESINSFEHHRNTSEKQQYNARMALLERILFLLNTLEVREVDLVEDIVARCKKSWYNEGKIAGMAEGLSDDEKYQQGWHDALEKQVPIDRDKVVKGVRRGVATSLINYIDANSKGMCLSNMECEDIDDAIVDGKWYKVYAYMKKKLEK